MTDNILTSLLNALAACQTQAEYDALYRELRKSMTDAVLDEVRKEALRALARTFSLEGFKAYYECKYGFPIPSHMAEAVDKAWQAHEEGVPFVLLGARGFWKTVTFITLDEYLIGHFPEGSGIITGANDANCNTIAKNIAQTIEFHPEWKRIFPFVVPMEKSWGAEGYWVRRTHRSTKEGMVEISQTEWVQTKAGRIDPTFVGGGYASSVINGKHPNLFLHADDLHDLDSWKSQLERERIRDTYIGQISKTMLYENDKLVTWNFLLGVPFSKEDTLNSVIATGNCVVHKIPAMVRAKDNAEGAVYIDGVNQKTGAVYDDIVGWWALTAPDAFGVKSVLAKRAEGKFSFWQMYMMDIETGKVGGLKYHLFDHTKIDPLWTASGGCDVATIADDSQKQKRDQFSVSYGQKTPHTTLVVTGGVLEHCTQARAEEHLKNSQGKFKNWRSGIIEGDGLGEQFYISFTRRNMGALWRMEKTKGMPKKYRQGVEMSPWLENGSVMISDEPTPYLLALREALEEFPNGSMDIRDGLYWLCRAFPECLSVPAFLDKSIPTPTEQMNRNPYQLESVWSHI